MGQLNALVRVVGKLCLITLVGAYRMRLMSFTTVSRALALLPGDGGVMVRRAWYQSTLASCGKHLYVDWMAAIKTPKTRIGDDVFIGTFCWIGWADIGDDVMFGGHVTTLSGAHHHSFDRLDVPMNRQPGALRCIRVGDDVWVGNGAILMADIEPGSVVAAGAVVTTSFAPRSVLAGVPARVIRARAQEPGSPGSGTDGSA